MTNLHQHDTSVQELVLAFRKALVVLTPLMDQVGIAWRDADAYDDWDEICQVLYKNIVMRSIEFSTTLGNELEAPEYGMVYPSYGELSFVELLGRTFDPGRCQVFVGFSSRAQPFDSVRYQTICRPDFSAVGEPKIIPIDEVSFRFVLNEQGRRRHLSVLTVQI